MKFLRLKGGLGNQIFQVMHALLKSSDQESIYVDVSIFGKEFEKDYAGGEFYVDRVLSIEAKKNLKYINARHEASSFFWKIAGIFKNHCFDGYYSDVSGLPQSINYRKYFDLTNDYNLNVDQSSVLIHVRKGDYTNSVNAKIYFNCEPDYFAKAAELISAKVSNPKFFIMSNDNDWVRKNFNFLKDYTILEINDPVLSFKVMGQFSNFIISNSTFSWWPAFLTKSQNVYAPKKWFLDEQKNINIYPDHWEKV
ncbi:MAG: alpha-1,2-fucosyltransferase [Bacteriovorax sp.]|nr:alpha-1,2-fucosyltransferase [Bacteriovorax sp.]